MSYYKILIAVGISFLPFFKFAPHRLAEPKEPVTEKSAAPSLYDEMNLAGKVNRDAFLYAVKGYEKIKDRKREVLTLIDFSKPSNQERLYVFDMVSKTMLYSSVVAHGKNSGGLMATHFSNREGSHQSSLGFYLTE